MHQANASINLGGRPKFKGPLPMPTNGTPCTSIQSSCVGKNTGNGLIGAYDGSSTSVANVDHSAYTTNDLQSIFKLPTPFTADMLAIASENAIQSVTRNLEVPASDRKRIAKFLKEAGDRLRTTISSEFDKQYKSSTYPKQARLASAALGTGDPM